MRSFCLVTFVNRINYIRFVNTSKLALDRRILIFTSRTIDHEISLGTP